MNVHNNQSQRYYAPLKRFEIDLKIDGEAHVMKGVLFLYEMNELGASFFLDTKLPVGSAVSLVVHAPNTIYLKGFVSRCVPILVPKKILHKRELNFRVGMQFEFDDQSTKTEFKAHCGRYRKPLPKIVY